MTDLIRLHEGDSIDVLAATPDGTYTAVVTDPRGRILDPFAGSGSTLRAARAEGLPCDGIEREPDFARLARFRGGVATLRDFEGLAPLRLPTDPRSTADELER